MRTLTRTARLVPYISALLASTAIPAWAEMSSAARTSSHEVQGLQQPAELIVDQWGIPHIYAGSTRDAIFLQGYNAARDRLWQIDLWRKRGLGLLAKDFGPSYVAQDRATRLFLYRGDMNQEWAAYGPDAKNYTEAFVAGINAFVDEVRSGRRPAPVEFRVAGTMPDRWAPEDVVSIRSHGLTRNVASEVSRARVACAAGLEADRFRRKIEPDWTTKMPDGLDPCSIPREVLNDYQLATRDVTFAKPGQQRTSIDPEKFLAEADDRVSTIGSNNWTIAPSRTATGRPILANDPHRAHSVPSLRYIVHLNSPELSVIGAGEPALPGISIGHNGQIAFGLTIFAIDQEDLFVYELNPGNPNQYRYRDGWEDIRVVRETIEVKGETPREVELRFTRHGPILHADPAQRRAFAMRSVWFEPGTSAYFNSAEYMTAKDWNGFKKAMANWGAPSENQVYADASGNIGWIVGGRSPLRPNWDGLMPVPGDGRYEWSGFLKGEELPQVYNPESGWFATANEMNLPAGYPVAERKVGFEWSDPSRITRIKEVLASKEKITLADAMALQTDDYTVNGRRLVKLLEPITSEDPTLAEGLRLLKQWDHRTSADSAAAALFEVWMTKHVGRALTAKAIPEPARAALGTSDIAAVVDYLENPDKALGSDPIIARQEILLESLGSAMNEVRQALGPDTSNWTWGKLHHALFEHALAPLADDPTRAQMMVGRLAMGGSAFSPRAASYRSSDFRVTAGASFRMVLDVGNWDQSVTINTPGQSGNPFSAHYRDLAPLWAAGDYVPLVYSRAAVERAARDVTKLVPAR
ncbi:penicillin acylase family protein [Microvirga sp. VF16]|uniref:penicillin acylase family protein n=1 Tax=Microvirga sp. VF16 TaxID=2807101 RepID=UPI00193EB201|nr:penicillin acylase family protein [Microvirga sp. VF16]QRM30361.1 penicillin acylase family protein [Microvirga sp. VF16]